ncbi:ABC transporter ATP-binding protein [Cupriavidus sp. 2TAF22]|uniref:ABC transporter ATP-binding protein n=1 Tax=unclassified Cupriavidus TaxID=2640874 RepID=UPI003F8EE7B6
MLLALQNVCAGYGDVPVLFDASLVVQEGEAVGLLGRNGMGRTTLINAVLGICPPSGGQITFRGARIDALAPHRIAQHGIGIVPEGRRIFPNLNVRENLLVAARHGRRPGAWTLDRVLAFFPRLRERMSNPGNLLSGGEQQMLAIGRALLTNPALLILDEATEGLAPLIREEIWTILRRLKKEGMSMIVVDKDVDAICRVVDRHYIMEKGRVAWQGSSDDLMRDEALRKSYLSVA